MADWTKFAAVSQVMSARAKNILLIEDHADSATVFARVLKAYGHRVTIAHSNAEAQRACEENNFDILLCDIELPDGNGLGLLEKARKICPTTQGIVISAHTDDGRRKAALEAGFREYLVKPLRAEDVREAIKRVATPPPESGHDGRGTAIQPEEH